MSTNTLRAHFQALLLLTILCAECLVRNASGEANNGEPAPFQRMQKTYQLTEEFLRAKLKVHTDIITNEFTWEGGLTHDFGARTWQLKLTLNKLHFDLKTAREGDATMLVQGSIDAPGDVVVNVSGRWDKFPFLSVISDYSTKVLKEGGSVLLKVSEPPRKKRSAPDKPR